ncbi:MAG: hypothetical protein MR009_03755, partial [Sutterellaceae bacterium]|nr:hypothetical protein [Sutterellaceae bacterium]MDD7442882.1 hypothetical protein [Sutterellaceae bacterium]MDY2868257.1 hypothetical protein [Mesosutterella sp.]
MEKRRTQTIRGVEYVYEPYEEWDEKRGRNIRKRRYVGKMEDGRFVPNRTYALTERMRQLGVTGPAEVYGSSVKARACGATEFFTLLSRGLGVSDDLEACFPGDWKAILSLGYYLGLDFGIPVYLNLLNLPPAQIRNLFVLRPVSQARFRISQAPNGNFISNSAFFSAAFSSGSAFAG